MLSLAVSILWFLIALVILVGIGWVVIWVLESLGIIIPPMFIRLAMIVLGLLCLIYFLTIVAGGGSGFSGFSLGSQNTAAPVHTLR
jgi:Na+-driven multidrug efflux pump